MSLRINNNILNQRGTPAFFSDVFANRPSAGFAGRVFISTDTGAIYEDTGSAWTLIADAGAGTTGTLQQVTTNGNTTSQGLVVTAGNVAIGTATAGAPLDIHCTGTAAQFNGTGTNNAYVLFQNAGANKWRLGNNYNAGQNSFDFYSYNAASIAASLNGNGSLLLNFNLGIKQSTGINQVSGYSNIATDSGGFYFNTGGANNAYLSLTGLTASRTYTLPDANGTLALTSQIPAVSGTTNYISKFTAANTLGDSLIYNNGTTVGINTTSSGITNPTLLINANTGVSIPLQIIADNGGRLMRLYNSDFNNTNTGTDLRLGFGAANGNTYASMQVYNSGETAFGALCLNGSGGNVIIGSTTDNGTKLSVNNIGASLHGIDVNTPNSFNSVAIVSACLTAASTSYYHFIGQSGNGSSITTNNIFIYGNGNVQNTNNSYGAISDIKLKENITDANPKLNDLLKIKIRNYNLINDIEKKKQIGVIAQELESIFPNLIDETNNVDTNGNIVNTKTKSVKYSVFVPIIIKAIQELNEKLERNNIN